MKLRIKHRLLLFISSLFIFLLGGLCCYLSITGKYITLPEDAAGFFTARRLIPLGIGVVCILIALFLFSIPHYLKEARSKFVIQQTDNGELRISVKAIENLVQKCIDKHEEIHVVSMNVVTVREGVNINLRISLPNNISIPLAVSSLQKQIKQYLAVSSGIEVKEVRVSVETTEPSESAESPYSVEKNPLPETEEAPSKKGKKSRVHNFFGKDESEETAAELKEEKDQIDEALFSDTPEIAQESADEASEESEAEKQVEETAEPAENPEAADTEVPAESESTEEAPSEEKEVQ